MSDLCGLYEIDLSELTRSIESGARKILVHAPDGLKPLYKCVEAALSSLEASLYYSASPGYGACDIPFEEAESLGVDLLLHLGHLKYFQHGYEPPVRVVYAPVYRNPSLGAGLLEELARILEGRGVRVITVSSTLIEAKIRDFIARHLSSIGFKLYNISSPILGCLYSHVTRYDEVVDAHLVVAGGVFHPLGLALSSSKPVLALDPYREEAWWVNSEAYRVLKKRYMRIYEAMNTGNRVGLIIGARIGQYRPLLVDKLVDLASRRGYRVYKITSSYLDQERLIAVDNALGLDFYVVTSCPRLPIDDLSDFYKPVLTPGEFIMLLTGLDKYIYPW